MSTMQNRLLALSATALLLCTACQGPETKTELKDSTEAVKNVSEQKPNTLTEAQIAEGWELLYDGESTKGWHVYQNKTDGSAWKSANGELFLDPSQKDGWQTVGGGDLLTDSTYENFHLSLEWKVSPKGNSGIIFGIQDDPRYEHSWHTGPEMQVLDNAGHPDGQNRAHRAGDLYDLISSSKEQVNPPGRWNTAEIRLDHGKLDLSMNGEQVVSVDMNSEEWKKLVANSKFKEMPDFGKFKSGHIALQDHGDPVWFRNIRIRKL